MEWGWYRTVNQSRRNTMCRNFPKPFSCMKNVRLELFDEFQTRVLRPEPNKYTNQRKSLKISIKSVTKFCNRFLEEICCENDDMTQDSISNHDCLRNKHGFAETQSHCFSVKGVLSTEIDRYCSNIVSTVRNRRAKRARKIGFWHFDHYELWKFYHSSFAEHIEFGRKTHNQLWTPLRDSPV